MPVIMDVERSSDKELSGGFRISGKGVNLWVRVYQTDFGRRMRLTISFFDGVRWVNTPPLWIDRRLCERIIARLSMLSEVLT